MKIFIFGPPGAGKSTLAFECGKRTRLPVFHIDHFFFKAPNIHISKEEGLRELKGTLPDDDWIVEGNHGAALDYVAEKADHVIIMNINPLLCTYRIIKRHIQNDPVLKKAVSEGWEETLCWQFIWFTLRLFPKNFLQQTARIEQFCKGTVHNIRDLKEFDYNEIM
jgi:adenylate kinase family enzyme